MTLRLGEVTGAICNLVHLLCTAPWLFVWSALVLL